MTQIMREAVMDQTKSRLRLSYLSETHANIGPGSFLNIA